MQHVVIGASQTDYSGYPDCRREFMDLFEQTFASAIGSNDITVHTPLMNLSKADTFALADRLGVLRDIIRGTLTCYDAVEALNEWGRGCGTCPACVLRQKGYEEWQATKEPAALNG
jgi:7-cyano-7-deazaguanine synthase